jgi:hypothetical protein
VNCIGSAVLIFRIYTINFLEDYTESLNRLIQIISKKKIAFFPYDMDSDIEDCHILGFYAV